MNIGIVTQWFASGAGHVSRAYMEVLQERHKVFIYARGGKIMKGHPQWDGSNVTWAPYHPCSTGICESHFTRWAKRNRIDVLLYNEQRHWAGAVLARKLGILSGAYVDYYTQDTVRFFDLYDFLICNTKRHYSVFQSHPQCLYVPWGTQTDVYRPPASRPHRPITFIISAGWCGAQSKGVEWMDRRGAGPAMRAFRNVAGDCRLLVLSQVPLVDCAEDWQQAVATDQRIEFRVGTFDPVPYWDGDIYVYPSRLDGIGLTLPEALSSGLPAITTDCPPMNEFVHDGVNGILVSVKDYRGRPDGYYWAESICEEQSLTAAMQRYVTSPELAAQHGRNTRSAAERELDWSKNASGLASWIENCRRLAESADLQKLACLTYRYDRSRNPTPVQGALRAVKLMATSSLRRCADWRQRI